MVKVWIGVFLVLSAVNSYGAVNYSNSANKGYSQSRVSNVSKYYKALDIPPEDKRYYEYKKPSQKVDVIEGGDSAHGLILSQGYQPIGYSEFKDRALPDSAFTTQANKIGAQKVLVTKQGKTTVTYYSDDDLNNLDHGYHYAVIFYVKSNFQKEPHALGITITDIPLEKTKNYQRNTGSYVTNVIKGSRAYTSNILIEDVITTINGREVLDARSFDKIKNEELEKDRTLNFSITRIVNNEAREVQIPVSFN